jgi:GH24 family phage-related lysozyme (muramidase)/uncharacterized protein YvpB
MKASEACLKLIKRWEGYHIELPNGNAAAYPDPAHGWKKPTIGFGSTVNMDTGMPVRAGEVVTRETAERWLRKEADKCAAAMNARYPYCNANQLAALTSLTFNIGVNGIGPDLHGFLVAKRWEEAADMFLEYFHADGDVNVEEGLLNRRRAERKVFLTPVNTPEVPNVDDSITWLELHRIEESGRVTLGVAAYAGVDCRVAWSGTDKKAFLEFIGRFKNAAYAPLVAPVSKPWPTVAREPAPVEPEKPKFPLAVPFYPQLDNPRFPTGTCNVTSVAMVLAFHGVKSVNPNEQLEMEVLRWMESRSLDRHVHDHLSQVMKGYGLKNTFKTNATLAEIKKHLDGGNPCIISGMFTASGHIVVAIGYTDKGLMIHDPFGEYFAGGYAKEPIATRGKNQHYSYDLIERVSDGDGSIWCHFPVKA